MLISYASDLHLEFNENKEFIKNNPLIPSGEILILAGDIVCFAKKSKADDFFNWCSDNFSHTYYIPGNHEFYSSDINCKPFFLNEKIKDNVFLVNNVVINYKGIDLIFSTLWSDISPINEFEISQRMNDFRVIKNGDRNFSPNDCSVLHKKSFKFIEQATKNSSKKKIVATHHVPTFMNYNPRYIGDILNEAFTTELFDFIEDSDIFAWISGHSHYNTPYFEINKTKMLTNQLGYVGYSENTTFDSSANIEI